MLGKDGVKGYYRADELVITDIERCGGLSSQGTRGTWDVYSAHRKVWGPCSRGLRLPSMGGIDDLQGFDGADRSSQ